MKSRLPTTKPKPLALARVITLRSGLRCCASATRLTVTKSLSLAVSGALQFADFLSLSTFVRWAARLKCLQTPTIAGSRGTGWGVSRASWLQLPLRPHLSERTVHVSPNGGRVAMGLRKRRCSLANYMAVLACDARHDCTSSWCLRRDSNSHGGWPRRILSPLRLPIPPLRHEGSAF